ncbi:hypothetical protein MKX01_040819 [Papaver californicum]|nr:hypothetical protein MKX01_040819 [Papaver californicum]
MEQKDSCHSATDPKYDCVLFDVDDTLYPLSSGLAVEEETKIEELCTQLYKIYGATMAFGYDFDYDDFHSFVHGRLPYNQKLKPDPVLRSILLSLPLQKVVKMGIWKKTPITTRFDIMGYCSQRNAESVLPQTPILCKPSEAALNVFFDDSVRNIQPAKLIGPHTVLVGTSQRIKGADYALESIHNITEALQNYGELTEIREGFVLGQGCNRGNSDSLVYRNVDLRCF